MGLFNRINCVVKACLIMCNGWRCNWLDGNHGWTKINILNYHNKKSGCHVTFTLVPCSCHVKPIFVRENSLSNTTLIFFALFDTAKLFLPYVTPMLKFVPFITFPSILTSNGVKWHLRRRFYPWWTCDQNSSHSKKQQFFHNLVQNLGRTSPVIWCHAPCCYLHFL